MAPIEFWLTVAGIVIPAGIGLLHAVAKFKGWY